MARYKTVNYEQMEMIPLNFSDQLIEGTYEHTLNFLIEEKADLSCFDINYKNDKTGSKAISPAILLKIILFAYSKGITTSRRIEEACRVNVIFKALSGNTVPDHSTIAAFVTGMKDRIKIVFQFVLMVCSSAGLIGGDMFAVDGCKLPSNASKEWSGTFKDLKKKQEKFEKLAAFLLEKHAQADCSGENEKSKALQKRSEKIRKKAEKIDAFLKSQNPKYGKRGRENQSNITDNESAKIKSSHGVIQGYNGLAVVDSKHQVITAAEAFGLGQEGEVLKPMVEITEENLSVIKGETNPLEGKTILGDTNYFSEENLKYLAEEKKMEAVIPDNQFRGRDERFTDRGRFKPKPMKYREHDFEKNEADNTYICPNGKILSYKGYQRQLSNFGHKYQARQADCSKCGKRGQCLKHPDKTRQRTLYLVDKRGDKNYSKEMVNKIDLPEIRDLYSRRMGIIEPVFGNIRSCKGMDRFTLRGKSKVNIQWLLFCIVHNIGKIQIFGKI